VEVGVIGCLTTTYQLTGDERFLASARLAAGYYGRLLDDGKLYGGPGDIEALVNSEVPMWYLRGFLRLWQATGSGEHRRLTLVAARPGGSPSSSATPGLSTPAVRCTGKAGVAWVASARAPPTCIWSPWAR